MPDRQHMKDVVANYFELIQKGTGPQIAELFAEEATVEDPVGGEVKRGQEAIRAFFDRSTSMKNTIEVVAVRVAGTQAAAHFRTRTEMGETVYLSSPIDVFDFDDTGLISALRAYWGPEDFVTED